MNGLKGKKIPVKNVWTPMVSVEDVKPGTITSGFKYGIEVAIVCDQKGSLFGLSNKMPPTGQPVTFARFDPKDMSVLQEPITGTQFNTKTGKVVGKWCPNAIGRLLIGRITTPDNIQTYQVRKSGNVVEAKINVNAKAQFEQNYWVGVLDAQGKVDGGYY